jgi:hypothetical protein
MVRLAGWAPRFSLQDNEQEEGLSGFVFETGFFGHSAEADFLFREKQTITNCMTPYRFNV